MKYDPSNHYENPYKPSFVGVVQDLLQQLTQNEYRESSKVSAKKFTELVVALRHLKTVDIGAVVVASMASPSDAVE